MLNELRETCKLFHLNELSYCILRMPTTDNTPKEFEADILVKDTEIKSFHNILVGLGFQYSEDGIVSHHHYRRKRLHLDLTISLCYGKTREHFVSLGYDVLERAVLKDGLYFVNEEDEFPMLVMRCLFDKRDFMKHSARIFQLIEYIGDEKCLRKIAKIFRSD